MESKDKNIPFHTRFGLRLLQCLLIVFAILLIKRCVVLYQDNKIADRQIRLEYIEKGFADGTNKALGLEPGPEPQFRSYSMQKAYREGYRRGWDEVRNAEKQ